MLWEYFQNFQREKKSKITPPGNKKRKKRKRKEKKRKEKRNPPFLCFDRVPLEFLELSGLWDSVVSCKGYKNKIRVTKKVTITKAHGCKKLAWASVCWDSPNFMYYVNFGNYIVKWEYNSCTHVDNIPSLSSCPKAWIVYLIK